MRKCRVVFRFLVVLLCVAVLLTGCLPSLSATEKTFSKAGMSIALPRNFVESERVGMTAYYTSREALVSIIKEEFSILEEMNFNVVNLTLKQYAEMAIENNKQDSVVREENGLISFEYQREMNGKITASLLQYSKVVMRSGLSSFPVTKRIMRNTRQTNSSNGRNLLLSNLLMLSPGIPR